MNKKTALMLCEKMNAKHGYERYKVYRCCGAYDITLTQLGEDKDKEEETKAKETKEESKDERKSKK